MRDRSRHAFGAAARLAERALSRASNAVWPLVRAYNERFERTKWSVGLFVYHGDHSPVRSIPGQPPMVDPLTAVLAVLGIGGALIHCFDPVLGLTLFGFAVTFAGTLIMTGNFDVARVAGRCRTSTPWPGTAPPGWRRRWRRRGPGGGSAPP